MHTDTEKRLVECIENVRWKKDKTEKECNLVKSKEKDLERVLVRDMQISDDMFKNLVTEVEGYREKMAKVEAQMKSASSAFMSAHSATMKVLGVAGKVKYHTRFCVSISHTYVKFLYGNANAYASIFGFFI